MMKNNTIQWVLFPAIQESSQSLTESGQIPIYKEFNKFFKLQYYIPVCCLLLYMDCGYNAFLYITRALIMQSHDDRGVQGFMH